MSTRKKTEKEPPPKFFATPALWRAWLDENHASKTELWVGFYKMSSGKKSITWPESVDEALCFGWIDGKRKSIDESAYKIRFTPRKKSSLWSAVNVKRVAELTKEGRMREAGMVALGHRKENKTYSFDREEEAKLPAGWQKTFETKNKRAWTWFSSRPPSYRRIALFWVMSAVKEETRLRRFEQLVESSANETTIGPLTRPEKKP